MGAQPPFQPIDPMDMEFTPLTEVILNNPHSRLGQFHLDGEPQPGAYLELEGQTYQVLERKHRYLLKDGRYQRHEITLYVQKSHSPVEKSLWDGRWVMGDSTCKFNARSELLRCAVNPGGPCQHCIDYQSSV
jgi:Family of unknown function (DUF6464)